MPKVQAIRDGVFYGGKTYNFGDEFEVTSRHAKLLRLLKKVDQQRPELPTGTAMETLPAFVAPTPESAPVPPPALPSVTQVPPEQMDEGQPDEETKTEGYRSGSESNTDATTDAAGQANRPYRGGRGSRTRS